MAKKSEVKQALLSQQNLLILVYKEAMLTTNNITPSLPSIIVSLLQDFEDVFPEQVPSSLHPFRGIEHHIDFISGASLPNCHAYCAKP